MNKAWRDASTELDGSRAATRSRTAPAATSSAGSGRPNGSSARGTGREPRSCSCLLTEDDSVESLEKASELVQRRLALIGRVNLLATGEFEVVQERHDFMARELEDVRKARRDLSRGRREGGPGDHRDVRRTPTAMCRCSSNGSSASCSRGRRAAGADGPGAAPHERDRDRGEPGPQTRQADQPAVGRRAIPHGDGVPVRHLHGAALAVLSHGRGRARPGRPNLHRFLKLVDGIRPRRPGPHRHAPETHDGDRRDDVRRVVEQGRHHEGRVPTARATRRPRTPPATVRRSSMCRQGEPVG